MRSGSRNSAGGYDGADPSSGSASSSSSSSSFTRSSSIVPPTGQLVLDHTSYQVEIYTMVDKRGVGATGEIMSRQRNWPRFYLKFIPFETLTNSSSHHPHHPSSDHGTNHNNSHDSGAVLNPVSLLRMGFYVISRYEDGVTVPMIHRDGTEREVPAPEYRLDARFEPLPDGTILIGVEVKAERLPLSSSHLDRRFRIGFGLGGTPSAEQLRDSQGMVPGLVWTAPIEVKRKQKTTFVAPSGSDVPLTPTRIFPSMDRTTATIIESLRHAYMHSSRNETVDIVPRIASYINHFRSIGGVSANVIGPLIITRDPCEEDLGFLYQQGWQPDGGRYCSADIPFEFKVPERFRESFAALAQRPEMLAPRISASMVSYDFTRLFAWVTETEIQEKRRAAFSHLPLERAQGLNEMSPLYFTVRHADPATGQIVLTVDRRHVSVSTSNCGRKHRLVFILALGNHNNTVTETVGYHADGTAATTLTETNNNSNNNASSSTTTTLAKSTHDSKYQWSFPPSNEGPGSLATGWDTLLVGYSLPVEVKSKANEAEKRAGRGRLPLWSEEYQLPSLLIKSAGLANESAPLGCTKKQKVYRPDYLRPYKRNRKGNGDDDDSDDEDDDDDDSDDSGDESEKDSDNERRRKSKSSKSRSSHGGKDDHRRRHDQDNPGTSNNTYEYRGGNNEPYYMDPKNSNFSRSWTNDGTNTNSNYNSGRSSSGSSSNSSSNSKGPYGNNGNTNSNYDPRFPSNNNSSNNSSNTNNNHRGTMGGNNLSNMYGYPITTIPTGMNDNNMLMSRMPSQTSMYAGDNGSFGNSSSYDPHHHSMSRHGNEHPNTDEGAALLTQLSSASNNHSNKLDPSLNNPMMNAARMMSSMYPDPTQGMFMSPEMAMAAYGAFSSNMLGMMGGGTGPNGSRMPVVPPNFIPDLTNNNNGNNWKNPATGGGFWNDPNTMMNNMMNPNMLLQQQQQQMQAFQQMQQQNFAALQATANPNNNNNNGSNNNLGRSSSSSSSMGSIPMNNNIPMLNNGTGNNDNTGNLSLTNSNDANKSMNLGMDNGMNNNFNSNAAFMNRSSSSIPMNMMNPYGMMNPAAMAATMMGYPNFDPSMLNMTGFNNSNNPMGFNPNRMPTVNNDSMMMNNPYTAMNRSMSTNVMDPSQTGNSNNNNPSNDMNTNSSATTTLSSSSSSSSTTVIGNENSNSAVSTGNLMMNNTNNNTNGSNNNTNNYAMLQSVMMGNYPAVPFPPSSMSMGNYPGMVPGNMFPPSFPSTSSTMMNNTNNNTNNPMMMNNLPMAFPSHNNNPSSLMTTISNSSPKQDSSSLPSASTQ